MQRGGGTDCIAGNQQRGGIFWEKIAEYYDQNRLGAFMPLKSLKMKWVPIKHDVNKFICIYKQVVRFQKSGTSVVDTLKRAQKLFHTRPKSDASDFVFEHCWILLKDYPRWSDESSPLMVPCLKRKVQLEEEESDCINLTNMVAEGRNMSKGGARGEERRRVFCKGRGPMRRASRNRAPEQEGGRSPTDVEGALLREVQQRGPLPA